ncbi:MAG: PEP-utilizing enzyme [Candidatus Uhrbacteria bacterium]
MVEKNLAEQFIAELGDQELWPTMYNCAPLVQTSGWTSKKYYEKFYKNQLPFPLLVSIKNNVGLMNIPITKPKQLAEEVLENFLSDNNYLKNIKEQCLKYERSISRQYEKLTDNYFATTSPEKITSALKDLCDTVWEYNASVFFSTAFDRETLENVLKKRHQIISDDFWRQASQPPVVSFERRHGWYLVEQADSPPENLLEKCQYFFAAYNNVPSINEVEDLLQQNYKDYFGFGGRERMVLEKTNFEQQQIVYKNWLALLSVGEIQLAKFIQQTVEFRDVRKDYLLMATTIIFRAAKSFLRKVFLPETLAGYLLFDELFCDKKYFKDHSEEIKSRVNGFDVFCSYVGEHFVEYGKFEGNQKVIEVFRTKRSGIINKETKIFGQIGSSGKAVGRVRKILNILTDSANFCDGEILVTGMTRPEYVPFMKKAAAIITDEGGITCHAAIVARELKKPCIIGTKIATQVLHDGDLVEVDADNGIVRKL